MFYGNILKYFTELKTLYNHNQDQNVILHNNKDLLVGGRPFFIREWYQNGILSIQDLLTTTGQLMSYQDFLDNRPRSIYQYSNMAPRLSGQNSIFGVVFFVSKSLLGIERQKKLEKFAILTRKPRSHARILIYRTWPITTAKRLLVYAINRSLVPSRNAC